MTQEIEDIFKELGLTQYLNAFVDQGFDAWDTILDIQESDLDALGVKLGHRRKLQRRIANARGAALGLSLASSITSAPEKQRQDNQRRDQGRNDATGESNGVVKRKYRRHPKPDENAPERPPSAYVLFSNKMREDLKSQNLTFTEIAKLVGENWQNLAQAEKEIYETQANAAKERYHRNLAEYKKMPQFREYEQYLREFKERQARQQKAQESIKRPKLQHARLRHGSTSSSATPTGSSSSGSGSGGSERFQVGDALLGRQDRVSSTASAAESQDSSAVPTPMSRHSSIDEPGPSPKTCHADFPEPPVATSHDDVGSPQMKNYRQQGRHNSWPTGSHQDSALPHLPSLSDMLDEGMKGVETTSMVEKQALGPAFARPGQASHVTEVAPRSLPTRTALPRHDSSSGLHPYLPPSSTRGYFGRVTPEGLLPIHALLADQEVPRRCEDGPRQTRPADAAAALHGQEGRVAIGHGYKSKPRGSYFSPFDRACR